ncbi:hypothetical protein [Siculibacillus lacustris]|nr:hypothetical protein [Siculibacillus lacustris]
MPIVHADATVAMIDRAALGRLSERERWMADVIDARRQFGIRGRQ